MNSEEYAYSTVGLVGLLGIEFEEITPELCTAVMPIRPEILQPFGFVAGGATLSLLETVASRAAALRADLELERCFGTRVDVRHVKPGEGAFVRGEARLRSDENGVQVWDVKAMDDKGDVMSLGTFETRTVSLARLAEKRAAREKRH